ncbi:hypothetical protein KC19_11G124200 [Ceratodon purpureus]|uniref:Uncharacterized protein n=1 Tax=Ceratodon purpureus TaxID=3225 RepID=A0A8T0GDP7_CERPU|nr:hypothetical protein KC19_11G124200 [Ceratodon purpureus]
MSRVLFCGVWRRAFLSLACTLRNPVFDAVGNWVMVTVFNG